MSSVSSVASANSAATTSSSTTTTATAKADTDYNTFLKLMVAQMKNQDPTEPMDATQFVAQLASFSSVEQAIQTNTKLDAALIENRISQAQDYVGKYIQYSDSNGSVLTEGTVSSVSIYSNTLTAKLDNGQEVVLGPGVTIINKAPTSTTTQDSETTA